MYLSDIIIIVYFNLKIYKNIIILIKYGCLHHKQNALAKDQLF